MTRLRLYANSASPFVRKVRIALYEKSLAFETIEIERGGQRAELLRINPRGEVPALVDGAVVVSGSQAICDYLEDRFPEPALLPAEPEARAQCRLLERLADTHTDVLQFLLSLLLVRRPELREQYPAALPEITAAVRRHHALLDRRLEGREYLVDRFSRADVAVVPHVTALGRLGARIPDECPRLKSWLRRMLGRPSVDRDAQQALAAWQRTMADPDPFFRSDRIHWRGERVEWAVRLGLGSWLADEVATGRAYFSPEPAAEPDDASP